MSGSTMASAELPAMTQSQGGAQDKQQQSQRPGSRHGLLVVHGGAGDDLPGLRRGAGMDSPLGPAELSARLGISTGSGTELVDRLVQAALRRGTWLR